MQEFKTVNMLRLEVESEPEGLVNLVQNPSGELGGWGWVTPVANTRIRKYDDGLSFTGVASTPNYFYTEPLPVATGQYAAARWEVNYTDSQYYRVKMEWLDDSLAVIGSSTQSGYLNATGVVNYGPHLAPASTAYARLRFDIYSNNLGANPTISGKAFEFKKVTVAKAATSGELGTLRRNLIPNPSFEVDTEGWRAVDTASIARTTTQAQTGTASLAITNTVGAPRYVAAQTNAGTIVTGTAGIPVSGSATYTASAYFRTSIAVGKSCWVRIYWYTSSEGSAGSFAQYSTSNNVAWTRVTATATAPANAAYASVQVGLYADANEVNYVDAVMLERADTADTYFDSSTPDTAEVTYASASHPAQVTTRTNLVKNPSFETNASTWFSNTENWSGATLSRSTNTSREGAAALLFEALGGSRYASVRTANGTSGIPVTEGTFYRLKFSVHIGSGYTSNNWIGARVTFYDSSGTYLPNDFGHSEQTIWQVATDVAHTTWHDLTTADIAPVGAAYARIVVVTGRADDSNLSAGTNAYLDRVSLIAGNSTTYFDGASIETVDFGTVDYAWTGTAHASTSTETTTVTLPYSTATSSNLSYIEPVPYLNILGPAHDIAVNREALNVGTLTATILDSTLDPSQSTLIRPGRRCRLTALDTTGTWAPLFTGKLSGASVTYSLKDPDVPDSKRARIEITATDNIAVLANQKREKGVAAIDDLPDILEGAGVPWNVNGWGDQVPTATAVAYNDNASVTDQVAITRDSNLGYAWVDRQGVLQVWNAPSLPATPVTILDETVYTGFDISYNTEDLINEVNIKFLRLNPSTGETEEVPYDPVRDGASITEWGVRSAEFTIQDVTEDPVAINAYALAILTTNATPVVRINSVSFPIKVAGDITATRALLDLYDLVNNVNATKAMDEDGRITGIEHRIAPDKWMVTLYFSKPNAAAAPTFTPSPGGGAGGKTIGQLLRPVGEVTMYAGATAPDGWLLCDGTSYLVADYPDLHAAIGYTFGGSGLSFNVPDFEDRFPIGAGVKALGTAGGSPTQTLTVANLAPHDHTLNLMNSAGSTVTRVAKGVSGTPADVSSNPVGITGSGTPFDIMPPWRSINLIIRAV